MSKIKPKLMIIDGNALIHRSFHALPPTMATKDGKMTNAVYGFTAVLLKAIKEFQPEYVVLTLDQAAPTFRHEEYDKYKANREKAADELYEQIPLVEEVAGAFNIPTFKLPGFEADDLIGTITRSVDGKVEKIIVTGDMDTMQLVNDHTRVFTMSRGLSDSVLYDEDMVRARYGLGPEQMIDYKALRGDPSDNIPGVKGIGEKTATELLKEFGDLDSLYSFIGGLKNDGKIKERIARLLIEHKEDAYMSKRLATIDVNAPIEFDLEAARWNDFDQKKVVDLFSELEFKSLLPRLSDLVRKEEKKLSDANGGGTSLSMVDKFERNRLSFAYALVDNDPEFKRFINILRKQKAFAIDTETTSLNPMDCDLLGISFSWKEEEAYYLNCHAEAGSKQALAKPGQGSLFDSSAGTSRLRSESKAASGGNGIRKHDWLLELKPILEDPEILKYGHNIKYDIRVLRHAGIDVKGVKFDTMIASYLLNPGSRAHGLDALAFAELGFAKISKNDLLGSGREKINFSQVAAEKLALYSCEDADLTFRLTRKLRPAIDRGELRELFYDMEMPLMPVLTDMEENGIAVDVKFLKKMSRQISGQVGELEEQIHKLAGIQFNIGSPKQMQEILFGRLDISTANVSKIKTGLSTSAADLEKLKSEHPIIALIQEYRELTKLLTTYIDALPDLVNKKTGRIHTSYNQTVTATGRLSSTDPNLQNIPVRTELGQKIRRSFVASPGFKLVALDYSQIELRVAAHMSGDQKMIEAFQRGDDIHTLTAAAINELAPEAVTRVMRREAKATNFGVLYGQGPHGLSQTADIPYARAKEFIDKYFEKFSGIKEYIDNTIAEARRKGYAETMFGRRRYLPEINSSIMQVRKGAERMAVNTPIQGTAADMIKAAMIRIANQERMAEELREYSVSGSLRLLLQVHDELLFEIAEDKAVEIAGHLKNIMEKVTKLKVPVLVDVKAGNSWGDMEILKLR